MKWEGEAQSDNVEDRRGAPKAALAAGGGLVTVVIMVAAYLLGADPQQAKQVADQVNQVRAPRAERQGDQDRGEVGKNDKVRAFAGTILGFTEKVWGEQFKKMGKNYEKPTLVLFTDEVRSGCGVAPSAVGPFYCPADRKLYLDPTFFEELETKLGGSKGEFSQAYVIAHEIGHHVQNLLGYSHRVDAKRGTSEENDYSVRLELQADYLAGVWAHYGQEKFKFLEQGDLESAIKTANSIGDDRLQKRSRGWASPESFTHGSAEQRMKWFRRGFESGDLKQLDHFFAVRSSREL